MMEKPFSYRKAFTMGLGTLGILFIWPIFNHFLPLFLQAGNPEFESQLMEAGKELPTIVGFGLAPSIAFFIMTWDNILNVFVQPWAGLRSDFTRSRFGKRKPWLMVGAPIAAFGFVFIPVSKTLFGLMIFIFVTNLGMAIFRSPTLAWLGDLFEPEDRHKANGVVNLMAGLGAVIAGTVGGVLFDEFGRFSPFVFGAVGMLSFISLAILLVKEPEVNIEGDTYDKRQSLWEHLRSIWDSENHGGIFILLCVMFIYASGEGFGAAVSSFAVFTLGSQPGESALWLTLARSSFILFAIPSGILGSRYGGRKIINLGLILGVGILIVSHFLVRDLLGLSIIYILLGFTNACANINLLPLIFKLGDDKKYGANTGMYYFSTQAAAILGPILYGSVIEAMGNNFRLIFLLSSGIILLAWLALRKVRDHPSILSDNISGI